MAKRARGRLWGIIAVTLGIGGFTAAMYPFSIFGYLFIPASVLCGGIAFNRGEKRLGGIGISLGSIAALFFIFLLLSKILRKALFVFL